MSETWGTVFQMERDKATAPPVVLDQIVLAKDEPLAIDFPRLEREIDKTAPRSPKRRFRKSSKNGSR